MSSLKTFSNPILPGFNPDPSICRVGDTFYLTTSTFEYWPGLPIYTSKNLINWTLIGHALNRPEQGVVMRTTNTNGGQFAPTIRYRPGRKEGEKDRWYIACCCVHETALRDITPIIGYYLWTEDIKDDKSWSNIVYIDETGIDQDLLFDDDGRTYLSTARRITDPSIKGQPTNIPGIIYNIAAFGVEIDLETGKSLSKPVRLRESGTGLNEGSHITKRRGWYYLFTADGGTMGNHQEWVSRSKAPLGPYEPGPTHINPILFNKDHPDIQNTGHLDLVEDQNGQWWCVFLAVRPRDGSKTLEIVSTCDSTLGRETFLARLDWDEEGWPVVNGGKRIELEMDAKGLPTFEQPSAIWREDFTSEKLDLGWYSVRTPTKSPYKLDPHRGLLLYGNAFNLDCRECPAMLVRKQTHFSMDFQTEMIFNPDAVGQEAGIVVWLSHTVYASLGVRASRTGEEGHMELVYREVSIPEPRYGYKRVKEDLPRTEKVFHLERSGPLFLTIKARKSQYELLCSSKDSPQKVLASGHIDNIHFEPLYVGTHIGVYAQGADWAPCLQPAIFRFVQTLVVEEETSAGVAQS